MIDVLLPYYRSADEAWPAIQSVLAQTYPHWRLICVDDAYPQEEVGARLNALGDERVIYLRNSENIGLARNFNRCLALVRSRYFVMLGDDDLMHPRFLESLARRIEHDPDIDVVQPGVRVIDHDGAAVRPLADRVKSLIRPRVRGDGVVLAGERLAESLSRGDWAYFPSLAWRTEAAKSHGFREEYAVALDYGLLLDIALDGGRMLVHDELLFDYRRHRASVSAATAATGLRFAQEKKFLEEYARRFEARGWRKAARIAHRRVIPRLNALVECFSAVRARDHSRARTLWGYVTR
ncbi:glycosyltransferase family 2 protein [Microbacterium sp. 22242]|uniref:glycosyltransferase family 2 protein n=1 Tax=Microbacterium sp. 22242 TaxID=3453896 RepID=UPI003F84431B